MFMMFLQGKKDIIITAFAGLGIALLSIPVALLVTIMLVPFWSWLEAETGFESLGHSGPAGWCYLVIYLLVVSLCGWRWYLQKQKKQKSRVSGHAL
jgi:H+/Cl- antiporter ClcA